MPHRSPTPAALAPEQQGLQLDQNLRQQRREWWVQRTAWTLFTLLLFAIALGLLGQGPLSHAHQASADGALRIDYHRFLRRHTSETLELQVRAASDQVQLKLSHDYLQGVEVENLFPEPRDVRAAADGVVFAYSAEPGAQLQIRLRLRPESVGQLDGWVSTNTAGPLRFSQFVYP